MTSSARRVFRSAGSVLHLEAVAWCRGARQRRPGLGPFPRPRRFSDGDGISMVGRCRRCAVFDEHGGGFFRWRSCTRLPASRRHRSCHHAGPCRAPSEASCGLVIVDVPRTQWGDFFRSKVVQRALGAAKRGRCRFTLVLDGRVSSAHRRRLEHLQHEPAVGGVGSRAECRATACPWACPWTRSWAPRRGRPPSHRAWRRRRAAPGRCRSRSAQRGERPDDGEQRGRRCRPGRPWGSRPGAGPRGA